MSLDRRHLWNHIRNTSVKWKFRAAPFSFLLFFFFSNVKRERLGEEIQEREEIRSFFSFTHEYLTSTKLEERNTIPFLIENNNQLGCVILY